MFDFYLNTKIKFGCGARSTIVDTLKFEGWTRVGMVVDHNLLGVQAIEDLMDQIQRATELCIVGNCNVSEPMYNDLDAMRKHYMDQDLHVIIGIGGGSAIDMAKAMAVLVHNHKPAIQYRGFDKMTEPVLPIVAIPTTAGTGSEVTPNASFVDSKEKRKMGINGEAIRPRYAFLDPELTLSCPERPSVSAAVDSLVHATEAYVAKKTNLLAQFFAREGFKRVFNNLPKIVSSPQDLELRSEVMYGAFLSGVALMHSGTGPAAAMSYPLGVHYQVPHGIGGGIFLPYVVQHNVKHGIMDYADLYQVMDGADMALSRRQQAEQFTSNLLKTLKQVAIPEDITQYGFNAESMDSFITETMELKGALDQNPVPFHENEIKNTLRILTDESHG